MKITPIEIRQKTFEKEFRGYEKEEVNAFLLSMSQEWEKLIDTNKEYRFKLELAEKEVKKLKDVENSLYKTLKTAEDTGTHLIEQASKSADLRLIEAQQKAEIMLTDAQNRAKIVVMEAEKKAKEALEEVHNEMRSLERDIRTMENMRDNMLLELKSMANDILERVNRIDAKNAHLSFDSKVREMKELIDKRSDNHYEETFTMSTTSVIKPLVTSTPEQPAALSEQEIVDSQPLDVATSMTAPIEQPDTVAPETPSAQAYIEPAPRPAPVEEKKRSGSFFDELEAS